MEILTLEKLKSGDFKIEEVYSQSVIDDYNSICKELLLDAFHNRLDNYEQIYQRPAGVAQLLRKGGFDLEIAEGINGNETKEELDKLLNFQPAQYPIRFRIRINIPKE